MIAPRPIAEVAAANVAANRRAFHRSVQRGCVLAACIAVGALIFVRLGDPEPAIHTPCITTTGACP